MSFKPNGGGGSPEAVHFVGAEDEPIFEDEWSNLEEENYQTLRFYKFGGRVYIEGFVTGGSIEAGSSIFTLPEGFQPTENALITAQLKTREALRVYVKATGSVQIGEAVGEVPGFIAINGSFRL